MTRKSIREIEHAVDELVPEEPEQPLRVTICRDLVGPDGEVLETNRKVIELDP